MARFYRCSQCGTLQGTVGTFSSEPEECDECDNREFEVVGVERDSLYRRLKDDLSVARAIRLMVGLGAFNFIATILFSLFGMSRLELAFGGANIVVLLLLAYGLTRDSSLAVGVWYVATLLFGVVVLYSVVVLVGVVTDLVLGSSVVGPAGTLISGLMNVIFLVYSVIYVTIFANLLGGREEFLADRRERS